MQAQENQRFKYYNDLPNITFKEYGRGVQDLVKFIVEQEDKTRRTQLCFTLIDLIKKLNPSIPVETAEDQQKLWDHLHIISEFKLDVDGPFPAPLPEILNRKPNKVPYFVQRARYRHYGNNLELMIKQACAITDPEEKEAATIYLGKLMKTFFNSWNKDNINDAVILKQLSEMSDGQLSLDLDRVINDNLFDTRDFKGHAGQQNNTERQQQQHRNQKHRRRRR